LCFTGFTAIVIVYNKTSNRSLTGGPEKNGEGVVDNLEREYSKRRREATGEEDGTD
jgi:hypothetical protein